jgi:hypothetical protein
MKINGSSPIGPSGSSRSTARASSGGFRLPQAQAAETSGTTARALGPTGIGSIDALLALQAVGGPLERRRRALRRADKILDVLDEVKISLLEGEVPANALSNLVKAVQQTRDSTDDPGLEAVLNEIETRAAVEIAKLETR